MTGVPLVSVADSAGPAGPVVAEEPEGIRLEMPPEPTALRLTLRDALLGGADWVALFGEDLGLGDTLWASWGSALEAAGLSRTAFVAVVAGYRRELWFWLLGDRIWAQVATGLAGRMARRLPESAS